MHIPSVTITIAPKFFSPKLYPRFWFSRFATAVVLMPKTPMNENRQVLVRKDYIWLAWQIFGRQSEPVPRRE